MYIIDIYIHIIYIYISNWIIGYIHIQLYIIYKKCKFNVHLYWIIRNVIIYCKHAFKFSVFDVIYLSEYTFWPLHSSLTYQRHISDTTSLKILVSAINLKACQITLLYSIRGVLRTQSSFYDEVLSRKYLTTKKSLTNFTENVPS